MEIRNLIGLLAGAISLIGVIPYIVSIYRGETKPARTTYLIKTIVGLVTLTSYIASGATTTVWISGAYALTAIIIFALSVKRGMGGHSKLDISCLALAIMAIALWGITDNASLALYLSIAIRIIATIPLVHKLYFYPKTENYLSWMLALVGDTLNLCALTTLAPNISLLPIFEVVDTLLIVALIKYRPRLAAR